MIWPVRCSWLTEDKEACYAFRLAVIANRPTDLPDGQISELAVQPHLQKYFPSRLTQIKSISIAVPPHTEGRFAIVTDVGAGCGGR